MIRLQNNDNKVDNNTLLDQLRIDVYGRLNHNLHLKAEAKYYNREALHGPNPQQLTTSILFY